MRLSQYPISTLKEVPADAEVVSHRLMLRTGMIRRLAAGLYVWLPLGLRTLRKVERIVREEMDRAGALELSMPTIQPAELWKESGRWSKYGPELLRFKDRHDREFAYGPTHEEVITDIARRELRSYKQLPVNFYQIQSKFRDEIRPRFGVMRAREFLMKDAYSFHHDEASLAEGYRTMFEAYTRIFTRIGLKFRAVQADGGSIGGSTTHEFHVLAESGEDAIVFSTADDYAANLEMAATVPAGTPRAAASQPLQKVPTPNARTIAELSAQLGVDAARCVKTLLVDGSDGSVAALVIRGDHELNAVKSQRLPGVANPLRMASADRVRKATGTEPGFIGPIGFGGRIYVDHAAAQLADFVCGANEKDMHFLGVNWGRDPSISATRSAAIRAPPAAAHSRLPEVSRSGTFFSSGSSIAAPCTPRCSTSKARRSPCTWAATASASPGSWPRPSNRITTPTASSGPRRSPHSKWCWCRSTIKSRRRCARRLIRCTVSSIPPESTCCSTIAMPAPE
jgi:prolyl-tRNA synthetase